MNAPKIALLDAGRWSDYALLDTGNGKKLEKFGPYRFVRPEPQALWTPRLDERQWAQADGVFVSGDDEDAGKWRLRDGVEERWIMEYRGLRFWAHCTPFRHLGFFPEQAVQWDWIEDKIAGARSPVRVINLFGYTGVASLIAARAGADVTHLDSSKKALTYTRENQEAAGLEGKTIRFICDDAMKFMARAARRDQKYDAIIVDPPKFGRGAKGEVWKLFDDLPELLKLCREALSDKPLFVVLTTYAIRASSLAVRYALEHAMSDLGGHVEGGEMVTREADTQRLLSLAHFSRWSR